MAKRIVSKRVYSRVFEPIFDELDEEYPSALEERDLLKAHMVRMRAYWSFCSAAFAQLPMSLLRMLCELWKNTKL